MLCQLFKRQLLKMIKHTQTIHRLFTNGLRVIGHFVGLTLKRLNTLNDFKKMQLYNDNNWLLLSKNVTYK